MSAEMTDSSCTATLVIFSFKKISLLWYILDHRWYISHTYNPDDVKGDIRSFLSGPVIDQGLKWEYRGNCITVR